MDVTQVVIAALTTTVPACVAAFSAIKLRGENRTQHSTIASRMAEAEAEIHLLRTDVRDMRSDVRELTEQLREKTKRPAKRRAQDSARPQSA